MAFAEGASKSKKVLHLIISKNKKEEEARSMKKVRSSSITEQLSP
jgi:hypothetical protein